MYLQIIEQVKYHIATGALDPHDELPSVRALAGAYLINAGRGGHVVVEDLLAALDAGHLAGAALDVFHREPPDMDSPFWDHPRVVMTPHNAADPRPDSVAPAVAENIRRALAGQPMRSLVDRRRGY